MGRIGAFLMGLSALGAGLQQTPSVQNIVDGRITKPYRGNVRGDHFYLFLPYKRVKGKWSVKR